MAILEVPAFDTSTGEPTLFTTFEHFNIGAITPVVKWEKDEKTGKRQPTDAQDETEDGVPLWSVSLFVDTVGKDGLPGVPYEVRCKAAIDVETVRTIVKPSYWGFIRRQYFDAMKVRVVPYVPGNSRRVAYSYRDDDGILASTFSKAIKGLQERRQDAVASKTK